MRNLPFVATGALKMLCRGLCKYKKGAKARDAGTLLGHRKRKETAFSLKLKELRSTDMLILA